MSQSNTGTYVYDKKLGKMVKISDRVPACHKTSAHTCCGNCCCHGK